MQIGELQVKESHDGELYFRIPDDLLDRLGWEEGDDIEFTERDGGFVMTKVKYETVELEFTEKELFRYMQAAHEEGLSFDKWVNKVIREVVDNLEERDIAQSG